MLVTSTLLFVGFVVFSGVDVVRFLAHWRTASLAQRVAVRRRLRFLLGYAITLVVIYGVYIASLRH